MKKITADDQSHSPQAVSSIAFYFQLIFLLAVMFPVLSLFRISLDYYRQSCSALQKDAFEAHIRQAENIEKLYGSYRETLHVIGRVFLNDPVMQEFPGAKDEKLWFNHSNVHVAFNETFKSRASHEREQLILKYSSHHRRLKEKIWPYFTSDPAKYNQSISPLKYHFTVLEKSLDFARDHPWTWSYLFAGDFSTRKRKGFSDKVSDLLGDLKEKRPGLVPYIERTPYHPVFMNSALNGPLWEMVGDKMWNLCSQFVMGLAFGKELTELRSELETVFGFSMLEHRGRYLAAELPGLSGDFIWEVHPVDFEYGFYRFGVKENGRAMELFDTFSLCLADYAVIRQIFIDLLRGSHEWTYKSPQDFLRNINSLKGADSLTELLEIELLLRIGIDYLLQKTKIAEKRVLRNSKAWLRLIELQELYRNDFAIDSYSAALHTEKDFFDDYRQRLNELETVLNSITEEWDKRSFRDDFKELSELFRKLQKKGDAAAACFIEKDDFSFFFRHVFGIFVHFTTLINNIDFPEIRVSESELKLIIKRLNRSIKQNDGVDYFLHYIWREQERSVSRMKADLSEQLFEVDFYNYPHRAAGNGHRLRFINPAMETGSDPVGVLPELREMRGVMNPDTGRFVLDGEALNRFFVSSGLSVNHSIGVSTVMELAESLQKPLHFTTEQAGKSFIGTVFPLKSIPDCCLYFQQPQDILYARIRFLRNLVLALSFGILLICLFLGRRFAGSIIDPLLNLIGFMETTKEGRLDTKISTTIGLSEGNEIDKLGSHYEKMVSRISEMLFRLELFSFLQSEISDGDETEPEKLRRKMLDHIINALVKRYQADFGLLGFFEQGLSEQSIDYACTGSGGICYKEKLLDELLRQREELCHKYQQIMPDEKTADGFNIIFLGLDETINYPSLSGNECLILYVSRNFPVYQLSLHGLLCLCLPPGRFDSEQTAALSDSVESICARSLSIIVKSWLDELKKDAQKGWEIQESLMPGVVPDAGGALDIACYYLSSLQKLAGDYYDFLMMADKPEVVVCTIADVSGKGIGASLFGASAKSFLQALDFTGLSTGHILQKLNQELVEISDRISSNGGSDMFLTMFIAAIDTGNDLLHYSSGGHNRMFLLHGENRSIEELSAKGLPLGMFSGAVYESKTVPFVKGDSLLLYTDGVTEMENADLELFGYERLREFCHQQAHCPAKEFVDRLSQDFDEYRSGVLPSDDITIVQIRNQRVSG